MKEQNKFLTSRQKEILSLLRKGLTNAEICRTLSISENTVKVHLANIYKILEVTNRTEAVSANLDETPVHHTEDNDVHIVVTGSDELNATPLAKDASLSIVEALHHYHLFRIRDNASSQPAPTYQIQVTGARGKDDTLFVTLYKSDTSEILWSASKKIGTGDDIQLISSQIAIQLFNRLTNAAAHTFEKDRNKEPQWWYISCFTRIKMLSASKESFDEIVPVLESMCSKEGHHVYAANSLVLAYYTAINESWVNAEEYVAKIGKIACSEMRNNPYSIHSQYMMAVYNIVIGNKSEAIAYFKQILDANPQDYSVRGMLAQIYLLIGKEDKALHLFDENERYLPESAGMVLQSTTKAFIYYLQEKYDECEEVATQVVLFHPETPLARLIVIACKNRKQDFEQSAYHIKKFFEYHPNFKKSDLEKLLTGVSPSKKDVMLECISNVFS